MAFLVGIGNQKLVLGRVGCAFVVTFGRTVPPSVPRAAETVSLTRLWTGLVGHYALICVSYSVRFSDRPLLKNRLNRSGGAGPTHLWPAQRIFLYEYVDTKRQIIATLDGARV